MDTSHLGRLELGRYWAVRAEAAPAGDHPDVADNIRVAGEAGPGLYNVLWVSQCGETHGHYAGVGGDGGVELEDGEVGGEPGVGRPGVLRVCGDPPYSPLLAPGLSRVKAEVLLTQENLEEKDGVL